MREITERLRKYRPQNEWGDGERHTICDEAATLIEALRKERDEALAKAQPTEIESLRSALAAAVETIQDYLAYTHDGDPWKEDSRAMGEMDINDYGRDGRLEYALCLLTHEAKP